MEQKKWVYFGISFDFEREVAKLYFSTMEKVVDFKVFYPQFSIKEEMVSYFSENS